MTGELTRPRLTKKRCLADNSHTRLLARFLWVLLGVSVLLTGCTAQLARLVGTSVPVSQGDLVGIWQADYEDILALDSRTGKLIQVLGSETLILRSDGTYEQVYEDGQGNITSIRGNRWYLDDVDIIHLVGGMWPQLGPADSALFADQKYHDRRTVRGKELSLDSGEAVILVDSVANALGERFVTMSHLGTGDPDNPHMVWFHRIQDQP